MQILIFPTTSGTSAFARAVTCKSITMMFIDGCSYDFQGTAKWRRAPYEMFLPTVWIRQAIWLLFVHEIAAPNFLVTLVQDGVLEKWTWATFVISRPAIFREMWFFNCIHIGKAVYWYGLMEKACNYTKNSVQMMLEGHRCAWHLSCSPWTWIIG